MNILGFNTSAAQCAAVLLCGDHVVAQASEVMGRNQVERLFSFLQELLARAEMDWKNLDALAVCTGPGNFTGTRIGVSAARGLMMSLNIPAVGVSVFEAAAMGADPQKPINIHVALPRDQIAVQKFEHGNPPTAIGAPHIGNSGQPDPFDIAHLARFAAAKLQQSNNIPRPAPLYLRPADAAPAKDQPPVILDAG